MKKRWVRLLLLFQIVAAALSICTSAAMPERLVPVGSTVGIRLDAQGLVVVGFDTAVTSAAREAGMEKGDVISTVNGVTVEDGDSFRKLVSEGGGKPLEIGVVRDGQTKTLKVQPDQDGTGYRLGVSLRDSMAGIGTVTFYDPEQHAYGALGHGVNEMETMVLLPLESGEILPSSVVEVQKGASGAPGMLKGAFNTSEVLGTVEANTDHGIFGHTKEALSDGKAVPVATNREIHTGKATILANVNNTDVEEYEVEITKLFPMEDDSGRNMLLTIKDPRLLKITGGIVQGMSGSPILQDGKLVGAVTHVLVNNPTCGYGIFIENMLEAAA